MDVDYDVDAKLLQQFSSLGTTDKEVLITELQKLLGNQLNPAGCAFFLDMNNWNLQAAICSYYDFEQPNGTPPSMSLVNDVTIGEGESVPPNTDFVKTWRVKNSGDECWPHGCSLKFFRGDRLCFYDCVTVDPLEPGQMTDISINMKSPSNSGMFQAQWRMSTATGLYFGEVIWAIITVDETGLLGLTQQMSRVGNDFIPTPISAAAMNVENPFGSPSKFSDTNCDNAPGSPNNFSMLVEPGSPRPADFSPDITPNVSPCYSGSFGGSPGDPRYADIAAHTSTPSRQVHHTPNGFRPNEDICVAIEGMVPLPDLVDYSISSSGDTGYTNLILNEDTEML